MFLLLWESWLLCGLFLSCRDWGLLFGCTERASHRGGVSCRRAGAPGHTGLSSCSSRALGHRLGGCGAHQLSCCEAGGILSDQESVPRLPHWQVDCVPLSHQGSPVRSQFTCSGLRGGGGSSSWNQLIVSSHHGLYEPSACACEASRPPRLAQQATLHTLSPSARRLSVLHTAAGKDSFIPSGWSSVTFRVLPTPLWPVRPIQSTAHTPVACEAHSEYCPHPRGLWGPFRVLPTPPWPVRPIQSTTHTPVACEAHSEYCPHPHGLGGPFRVLPTPPWPVRPIQSTTHTPVACEAQGVLLLRSPRLQLTRVSRLVLMSLTSALCFPCLCDWHPPPPNLY